MKFSDFEDLTISGALKTLYTYVLQITNGYNKYIKDGSLADVTKLTRVEPLTIVSSDLLNVEYMKDVNNSLLNLFSAYYLQAVSIAGAITSVDVIKVLDKLNPNRGDVTLLSLESHPSACLENYKYELPKSKSVALELDTTDKKHLNESSNLSVGKIIEVDISTGANAEGKPISVKVPIAIRLLNTVVSTETIVQLLAGKTEDRSLTERYFAWRSGRISFIRDLILCQDLIDEQKRRSIKDESGVFDKIMNRVISAKKWGAFTNNPSLVVASNIFVVSEQVAKEIEVSVGGKLTKSSIRNKLFENTYAMILVVVDREWERVTFYTRGMDDYTELSAKEIKAVSKGGSDIADILKSLQLGTNINF